jgi:transposase-like protein
MLMITCTVTGTRELASLTAIRSIANHPDHIAVTVTCPACGQDHVHRTGRRAEEARRARSVEVAVRRAAAPIPA